MIIHRIIAVGSVLLPVAGSFGCIDEHHEPAHHPEHYEEHHEVQHYDPVVHQPPPAHPPAGVTGRGHYVWDSTRSQYLWISDP